MPFNLPAGAMERHVMNLMYAVYNSNVREAIRIGKEFMVQTNWLGLAQDGGRKSHNEPFKIPARVLEQQFTEFASALLNKNAGEAMRLGQEFLAQNGWLSLAQDFGMLAYRKIFRVSPDVLAEQFDKFMRAMFSHDFKEALRVAKEVLEQNGYLGTVQGRLKHVMEFLQTAESTLSQSGTIHTLSKAGKLAEVTSLIESGVDINAKDGAGKTPLHYAVEFGHDDVGKLLLQKGASYNARNKEGATPLKLTKTPGMRKLLTTVKGLFDDVRAGNGERVLQHVSEETNILNFKDKDGCSALVWSVHGGYTSVAKMLLEFGANATMVSNKGNSSLHIAASRGHGEIVVLLLRSVGRAKLHDFINGRTGTGGNTPLHVAAERGFSDIVKTLLGCGAVYSIRNKNGKTPGELAVEWRCSNILKLIDDLFQDAKNGSSEIISKLKSVESQELNVVSRARDVGNFNLIQVAFNSKHSSLARMLVKLLKDNYLS